MTGVAAHDLTEVSTEVIYFSSTSENTRRFVDRLGRPASRLPLTRTASGLLALRPFVLICPTYGCEGTGHVPPQVVAFLNHPPNRGLLRGVIASGNTNFGADYCKAGDRIAAKCGVPYLYRFELAGTSVDVERVFDGLDQLWTHLSTAA